MILNIIKATFNFFKIIFFEATEPALASHLIPGPVRYYARHLKLIPCHIKQLQTTSQLGNLFRYHQYKDNRPVLKIKVNL